MNALDIAVVGAGTAGTAVGLLLARDGHRVTLYERVDDPQPVGAGIVLQPTGQAVLQQLGLFEPILEHGARIDRLRCIREKGRTVIELEYPAGFGLGLHRGVLFETLLQAAKTQAGLELRCGVDVVAPQPAADGIALRTADGDRLGPHELIIVADGARSTLRANSGLRYREDPYPWGALWHVTDDVDEVYAGELFQSVRGTGVMLGLLPTGRGPTPGSPKQVSLYWSLRADRLEEFRSGGFDAWKKEIRSYDPRAAFVLDTLKEPADVLFAHYRHVTMPQWHGDRIVLLGDAAHAMSPQLGQGCNLALVDAAVLAHELAKADHLPRALSSYTRERRAHLTYYMRATRWLTPFFQSNYGWLGVLRDLGMPVAAKIPWIRNKMFQSMAGNVRGVVRRPLPLASLASRPALGPGE